MSTLMAVFVFFVFMACSFAAAAAAAALAPPSAAAAAAALDLLPPPPSAAAAVTSTTSPPPQFLPAQPPTMGASLAERKQPLMRRSIESIRVDAVVDAHGTGGGYSSIATAVEEAARARKSPQDYLIIYIKEGVYGEENITIHHDNVVLIGDGIGKTVITGHRSNKTGHSTPYSATLSAFGKRFMARDLTIENTAGAADDKQAVALRSTSNESVLYSCEINGFQDTLYAESGYQFYRQCIISGTVDFVFGDALVMFQDCTLYVRRPPTPGQHNVITAQGRNAPENHTGFSFHNCIITTRDNLSDVETYLGRPWKKHALVVFMLCTIDDIVHRNGWVAWKKGHDVDRQTVVYREYKNNRLGANSSRGGSLVDWEGFQVIGNDKDAQPYTVDGFINGTKWLPNTGVPFDAGLYRR